MFSEHARRYDLDTVDLARASSVAVATPESSWRGLYRSGAFAVAGFILLTFASIVAAAITRIPSAGGTDTLPDGMSTLQYIANNRTGFIIDQILILGPIVLTIVVFLALYAALKHLSNSYSALGALMAIISVVSTFSGFSIVFGLVYLSDRFASAANGAQQAALATTAEGLIAQLNTVNAAAILWPLGILILSLIMLKGVFPKAVAAVGIVTGIAGIVSEILRPVIGSAYGIYGILLLIWLIAVGWKLQQLSRLGS